MNYKLGYASEMRNITRLEIIFGLVGLAACVFFAYLDFSLSNNIAISTVYISMLGFGLLARSKRLTILLGLLGIFATVYGYYLPGDLVAENDFTNRQLVIITILIIMVSSHIFLIMQEESDTKLYKIATTDDLTGVANRRALFQELENRISEAIRYDKDLTILLCDLDNLKVINDKYGHLAGDFAMKKLTQICQTWLRTADYIGRYGGDEFIVICPSTSLVGARALAERIRTAVETSDFTYSGKKVNVTISIGLTQLSNHLDKSATKHNVVEISRAMIDAADSAMYYAKRNGENRTIAFDTVKNNGEN